MGACYGTQSKYMKNSKVCHHKSDSEYEDAYEKLKLQSKRQKILVKKAIEAPMLNLSENSLYKRRTILLHNEIQPSTSGFDHLTRTFSSSSSVITIESKHIQ
ncbi:unnamed protein product [Blepharisma stoltei]|uniref:Uncharacterized protein n=1 Tax=Blepharisma stoltei TaxID=1481888 RepID=A0AAU9JVK5_9CILI|nr:unnamed protein product [Blepharisma stoltei]